MSRLPLVARHDSESSLFSHLLKQLGFPVIEEPFYPDQKEVSLLFGILPHFVIGYFKDNNFIVNPAIFNEYNKMRSIPGIVAKGLKINQTNFREYLYRSRYHRGYIYDGEEYFPFI